MEITRKSQPMRRAAALALWTLCVVFPGAVGAAEEGEGATTAAAEVRAGELAGDPQRYMGKNVSVRAQVETVYGSRIFTLDEDRLGAGPDVLVLVPDHAPVSAGSTVTVNGTVRQFAWTDLRRDYGWFDLRPELEIHFRSRPVVVATSVRGSEGAELVGQAKQPPLDKMAQQPGDFYGNFVSVRAQVGEIESAHVFTLERGTGQPDVLVLIPDPDRAAKLSEDAQVTVKGVVRPFFVADLERDYDWFGLDQDLMLQLEDRPVIVAESVRNEAGKEFVEVAVPGAGDVSAKPPTQPERSQAANE